MKVSEQPASNQNSLVLTKHYYKQFLQNKALLQTFLQNNSQILILCANIDNFMSRAIMDAVESIEIIEMLALRVFRDRTNPFEMYSEEEFKQRFRFKKQIVHLLLHLISSDLEHGLPNNNNFIPPILQIAVAFTFLRNRAFSDYGWRPNRHFAAVSLQNN